MTRMNNQVTARAILSSMGRRLIGRDVETLAIGDWPGGVEIVPGHQSACFAGELQEKRGLK